MVTANKMVGRKRRMESNCSSIRLWIWSVISFSVWRCLFGLFHQFLGTWEASVSINSGR